jgi:DNA polymerase-3 subunit gamma/tau
MVLVRLAYAADLPSPDEIIRALDTAPPRNGGTSPMGPASSVASAPRAEIPRSVPRGPVATLARPAEAPAVSASAVAEPTLAIASFPELIALAAEKRDIGVKAALERDVRLVRCEDGRLEIALQPSAARTLVNDLARKFTQWTGRRWMVVISGEQGEPTVHSQNEARAVELKSGVRADPLVQAVLARFPGAEIVDVRQGAPANASPDAVEPPPTGDFAESDADYGADWLPGEMDNDA